MITKCYSDLVVLVTFDERLKYLKLTGKPGEITFGYDRYINQILYRSWEWRNRVRPNIILRDNGCDLGVSDREIIGQPIIIHHINPITIDDIKQHSEKVFDPENLICCTRDTHEYIHYGVTTKRPGSVIIERKPNDTVPWRK